MMPLLPVLAAGLVPFIAGSLWYHPSIFGAMWMRMKHITPEKAERASRLAFHSTGVMIVVGIFMAFMLSHVIRGLGIESYSGAIMTSFGIWLGFIVPSSISRVLWDHIPLALYAIETGLWLISLLIMGLVLMI